MQPVRRLLIVACATLALGNSLGCATLSAPRWLGGGSAPESTEALTAADQLPKSQTVQACLATADQLSAQGHVREAALLLEKAQRLDPQAAEYPKRLAGLYDLQGDPVRATAEFRRALAASPGDAQLLNDFGCLLDRQGNHDEAEGHLRRAVELEPQNQRAITNLAICVARQGRHQEAFDLFASVVGPAAAHTNVGMLLARGGRTTEAQAAFRNALAIDPTQRQASMAMEYLAANSP
jgi:Tfp pilus assembly protein PilF